MSEERKKNITIGCGIWGTVLSAVIIASRAACGSTPMEEWSVWSWFLMTLPVTAPAIVAAVAFLLFLVGVLIGACVERRGRTWR